jgi:hypothetical protein
VVGNIFLVWNLNNDEVGIKGREVGKKGAPDFACEESIRDSDDSSIEL